MTKPSCEVLLSISRRHKQEEGMKTPRYIKAAEIVAHATGVTLLFRPAWNEYKECKKALERSERLLAEQEANKRAADMTKPLNWNVYFWVDSNRITQQYVTITAVSEREARRKFRDSEHGGNTITAVDLHPVSRS